MLLLPPLRPSPIPMAVAIAVVLCLLDYIFIRFLANQFTAPGQSSSRSSDEGCRCSGDLVYSTALPRFGRHSFPCLYIDKSHPCTLSRPFVGFEAKTKLCPAGLENQSKESVLLQKGILFIAFPSFLIKLGPLYDNHLFCNHKLCPKYMSHWVSCDTDQC